MTFAFLALVVCSALTGLLTGPFLAKAVGRVTGRRGLSRAALRRLRWYRMGQA